ncbi:MAG: class I SAM-dependent methyltransferase [Deltaproteobacteria bacterium]|nr:class I SAM-dependent methyltransferase [Deltaproteobacteria bacterium]
MIGILLGDPSPVRCGRSVLWSPPRRAMEFDKLANSYLGEAAERYNDARTRSRKWANEQARIAEIIASLAPGSSIVDVPVGTGRFLELYVRQGLRAVGLDISDDMLAEARKVASALGGEVELRRGDIRAIDAGDRAFDTVLCVRFLNWIGIADVRVVVRELARVARRDLVLAIRHYTPVSEVALSRHDVVRFARQLVWRARRRIRKRRLVMHEKRDIDQLFRDLELDVLSATTIERRDDGTDYVIYHARRTR